MSQSLARSDLTEGKLPAEQTNSVPAMKRKYVQKPTDISHYLVQKLPESEIKVLTNFEQGFHAFKCEKI